MCKAAQKRRQWEEAEAKKGTSAEPSNEEIERVRKRANEAYAEYETATTVCLEVVKSEVRALIEEKVDAVKALLPTPSETTGLGLELQPTEDLSTVFQRIEAVQKQLEEGLEGIMTRCYRAFDTMDEQRILAQKEHTKELAAHGRKAEGIQGTIEDVRKEHGSLRTAMDSMLVTVLGHGEVQRTQTDLVERISKFTAMMETQWAAFMPFEADAEDINPSNVRSFLSYTLIKANQTLVARMLPPSSSR